MKRLAIMRHAKSSWSEPGRDDFDRPLNDRGRAAAERIGRELKQRELHFDHVLASPALRVRQTLDQLGRGYGEPLPAEFEEALYSASSLDWLAAVQAFPEAVQSPLIVGHNPALHHLLVDLARDDLGGRRRQVVDNLPTGALAIVALDVGTWRDVVPDCGEIAELILPRELD